MNNAWVIYEDLYRSLPLNKKLGTQLIDLNFLIAKNKST